MAKGDITLSNQEVLDLVLTIVEGIDAIENAKRPRESWSDEMRDWCLELLARTEEEGGQLA